ncbi:MAG: ROK family protein [Candidatus Aenigmatarchaeota archaeon]
MSYKAAVDIGGTKITVSIMNRQGYLIRIWQAIKLDGPVDTIPKQIDDLIEYCCSVIGINKKELNALGISTCGPFKKKEKYLTIIAPNLCGGLSDNSPLPNNWREIPLEEELAKIYSTVKIGNDCATAVVAERLFGAGKNEDNIVYVTWSTGIGTGAFVDGKLIKGMNNNAPHGGHIYVAEDGDQCGCGQWGDLESLVSGRALVKDSGCKTTEEVFSEYNRNNEKAKKVIEKAAKNFARGLVSINAILDTRLFIIGGTIFSKNSEILLPLIQQEFSKGFTALTDGVEIKASVLDRYLGDIAALSLIMPEEWIKEWQEKEPWKNAPEYIILE